MLVFHLSSPHLPSCLSSMFKLLSFIYLLHVCRPCSNSLLVFCLPLHVRLAFISCFPYCPPFSPPFCHPPFQPTYSTFALDTHLYFLSFIFVLHLTISSFIFHPSFQVVPLQLYSPCYSLCQVHFHKYSACLVHFHKCQLDNFDDTTSRSVRYSACLVYIHKCQLDKFFFHVAVG